MSFSPWLLALTGAAVLLMQRVAAATPAEVDDAMPVEPPGPVRQPPAGSTLPRGIRNHNPGNLRPGSSWQGLDAPDHDSANYLRFTAPEWGIRAMTINLLNQQFKHGLRTVRDILYKYAPPSDDNDTESYIRVVSGALGVTDTQRLELTQPALLDAFVRSIIRHENGRPPAGWPADWYDHAVIADGIGRARRALSLDA